MAKERKTPVAFISYNRPLHTRRALQALSDCNRKEECDFHFFSDGPKSDSARADVLATREVLAEWATPLEATLTERSENLGLAKSIVTGVSDLCARYGRVIVVEDDLVVSPDFLHYMIESLDRYENHSEIMQVGGFTVKSPESLATDAFLLPVTTTWGWATWQRAWQHFAWQPEQLDTARNDLQWRRLFDLNGSCAFSAMLDDRLAGRNDSWGILWWYAVSRQQGLVVYPKHSLVWNGGFDGSGVHCGKGDFTGQNTVDDRPGGSFPVTPVFPAKTEYETAHLAQLEDFFRSSLTNNLSGTPRGAIYRGLRNIAKNIRGRVRNALH